MEIDPRAWPQNGCGDMERVHYGDGDQGQWSNPSLDVNKQGYYPRTMGSYHPGQQLDRGSYYQDHSHAVSVNMTSCETSMYEAGPMGSVAPPHGMYDSMPHHYPQAPSSEMEHWHIQMMSQSDPFLALPIREERSKRKRRRVISMEQRKAANIRERRRMYQLNEAFDILRKRVPTFAYEKKLSRIETLKLAVTYIEFMGEILENNGEKCKELIEKVKDQISTLADDDSGSSMGEELLTESPSSGQSMKDTSFGDNDSDHTESEEV